MQVAFKVVEGSGIHSAYKKYFEMERKQLEVIKSFAISTGIESKDYYLGGEGRFNVPFQEQNKKKISLGIVPTENDKILFGKELRKEIQYGLCKFKANSKTMNKFRDLCVESQVVINLLEPSLRDYVDGIGYAGFRRYLIPYGNTYIVKIECDNIINKGNNNGLEEIKLSEFYQELEKLESK